MFLQIRGLPAQDQSPLRQDQLQLDVGKDTVIEVRLKLRTEYLGQETAKLLVLQAVVPVDNVSQVNVVEPLYLCRLTVYLLDNSVSGREVVQEHKGNTFCVRKRIGAL